MPSPAEPPTHVASVILRAPSKYASASSAPFVAPSPAWLLRTWTVTHSTLSMWRTAQNVRITYTEAAGRSGNQDLVEYEDLDTNTTTTPKVHTVQGANTPSASTTGAFDWRGKGWLFFVTSHWEILGWGEVEDPEAEGDDGAERWAVTWFAATLFTREGIDLYSSRRAGLRPATVAAIRVAAAAAAWPEPLAALVRNLQPVAIV
ncbi:hypothetical protein CMQ_6632 [Grosmannia clavigera kw1407]|uniref:Uncharacterized protein n=1 Tax=Grosmannia clavigera (strain kw1407 / UAMH 11150) TaxID=655863 RepID=F0X7J4_GROCL|nr:uncharacterized protein CMQ_6632 [Grosmannia clavigera kw1407]EFX06311.1 hypothetical protein CMQ_6632 [Grosmannia clavigera kw1407]